MWVNYDDDDDHDGSDKQLCNKKVIKGITASRIRALLLRTKVFS